MKTSIALVVLLVCVACSKASAPKATAQPSLEGAWRSHVTFTSGPLKGIPFQFLITYAAGGGLVESSNFDESPPVLPAYGSWGRLGPTSFKSTYIFWTTSTAPKGWTFSGSGILSENITIAKTGDAYASAIAYQLFDTKDVAIPGQSGTGSATASRIIVG
jgi:hypothetical protein